jgi:hypothetical protein
MEREEIDHLVDSSHFIDDSLKERCKDYFKQIDQGVGDWIYAPEVPADSYQGDILNHFEIVYQEVVGDDIEIRAIEAIPCMLLSNTCDLDFRDKSREKFVSVAPVLSFDEFAENFKAEKYSEQGLTDFLEAVKKNKITDILYIPGKNQFEESVVLLDKIYSADPKHLKYKFENGEANRILSLSQTGFYFFLIKLTYHFARYEDKSEIVRAEAV